MDQILGQNPGAGPSGPIAPPSGTPPVKGRKARLWFILSAIIIGAGLGVAAALTGAWLWGKNYVESPRFWRDLSANANADVVASATRISLFPPSVSIANLEVRVYHPGLDIRRGNTSVYKVKTIDVGLRPASLLLLRPELVARLSDVAVDWVPGKSEIPGAESRPALSGARPSPFSSGRTQLPDLPFSRIRLDLLATNVSLPLKYLPATQVALVATAKTSGEGVDVQVERFGALGIVLTATGRVDRAGEARFELRFPEKESLVSGQVTAGFTPSRGISLNGALKLPNTEVPLPEQARWTVGGQPLALSGGARLSGGAKFNLSGSVWSAQSDWALDFTKLAATYGPYSKKAGWQATLKGKFSGDNQRWSFSEVEARLGQARALVNLEAGQEQDTRVFGSIAPFEITEFLPLLHAAAAQAGARDGVGLPKGLDSVSGKASARVELVLPRHAPGLASGTVDLTLDRWVLDGGLLAGTAAIEGFSATGDLELRGHVKALLDHGAFRRGSVEFIADATPLGFRYKESVSKKRGIPLQLSVSGEGSGKTLVIKGIRLDGPSKARILARGRVSDFKDFTTKLQFAKSAIPLPAISMFLPTAKSAGGWIQFSGQVQGPLKRPDELFANLNWEARNAFLKDEAFLIRGANARLQTILGAADAQAGRASSRTALLRVSQLSFEASTPEVPAVLVNVSGNASYKGSVLTGDIGVNLGALNLDRWLKKKMEQPAAQAVAEPAEQPGESATTPILDFGRSKLKLSVAAPVIRTGYADISAVRSNLRVGSAGAFDVELEKLVARGLEGELHLKGKLKLPQGASPYRVELTSTTQDVSMVEVSRLLGRLSGKDLAAQFFGKGSVDVTGHLEGGLETANFRGKAEVAEGGFRFLPLPGSFLEHLLRSPLADKLGVERQAGAAVDRFEQAKASFELQGEKLTLSVLTADRQMTLKADGFVTLGGHCELNGNVVARQELVGGTAARILAKGIPFSSTGDNWSCEVRPDLRAVAEGQKAYYLDKVRDRIEDKARDAIQSGVKGILKR